LQLHSLDAMHLIDIADAIDLSSPEARQDQQQRSAAVRNKRVSRPPKAMAFGVSAGRAAGFVETQSCVVA
jgi:hypothetical protein